MKRFVAAIAVAALSVGACKTLDPFTGEEKYNSTSKGAAIGAGAGAAAGAGSQVILGGQRVRIPSETRLTFVLDNPTRF
jgi:hypothetical protein